MSPALNNAPNNAIDKQRAATDALVKDVERIRFGAPVCYVYNPLIYAREIYDDYVSRYGMALRDTLLVGMNPGPFGMAQTGVPFGDVAMVRDWLQLGGRVDKPLREHPKRLVAGFGCTRREVSGTRLWSWAKRRYGSPAMFFERYYVHNYCPLAFVSERGANLTPDKLAAEQRQPLFDACDRALCETVERLAVNAVIGIGVFAEARCREALKAVPVKVGRIPHPSPASPQANKDWDGQVERALAAFGMAHV